MAHGRRTILMVEDEPSITAPLIEALEREGFESAVARTAGEGISLASQLAPDLVLLDVMLPDGSGYDVCRELRRDSEVPIIMLSARGEETDRIVGLEVGADDHVVKPFSARELVARIRAVLRRARPPEPANGDEALEVGDVRLDPSRHEVVQGDSPLELTRKEFELLRLLMRNAGAVVSREQAIEEVWDVNWFGPTKTLDVHVSALRKKLGDDPAGPRYLHTVRGVGFRFAAPSELAPEDVA
jgi:two-component system, OmpR family, response regulator RegX3